MTAEKYVETKLNMSIKTKVTKRSPDWYGRLPDLPDHRDLLYSAIAPKVIKLPRRIDL
jgi:hypothetical protein